MTRRTKTTGPPALPPISEKAFLRQILQLARLRGWHTAHFRPARTVKGWRTAVQGDGRGFPDVLLVRHCRVVLLELKTERGKLTREQMDWIYDLQHARLEVYVWRPKDWPEIERTLA